MSIVEKDVCEWSGSRSKSRRGGRRRSTDESYHKIGHCPGISDDTSHALVFSLPEPTEETPMGDILRGIMEDRDADPVEEVREIRRNV